VRSLAWKLGSALVLVAVIAVAVMSLLTNLSTGREFRSYVSANPMFAESVGNALAIYYLQNQGNWSGIDAGLPDLLAFDGDRLVLADSSGTIVGDTAGILIGQPVSQSGLSGGRYIQLFHQRSTIIGQFFYLGQAVGPGGMMGMGGHGVNQAEQDFLDQTNRWLWLSGGIAAAIAVALAVVLAFQFIRPLKALGAGAKEIAAGNLGHRVEVKSHDETGRLAESFNAMAGSLQKSEEARKRLLADVAHELRTPLTIINGTVDAMMDGVLPTDERQLKVIKGETVVLTRLISDLRDLSLAEAGKLKLELSTIDWADLIRRRLDQFRPLAEAKGLTLSFDSQDDLPPVAADWVRLEQVLANLLSNALCHTPEGGRIAVSLKVSQLDDKPAVTAVVADTGEGMAADELEHIFDRFYRIEDSRTRAEGNGAGLGLAIVKQMVTAHGGQVRVESELGRGSTFYVTLPAADENSREAGQVKTGSSPTAS
jgi:signal transduction histidine kinase